MLFISIFPASPVGPGGPYRVEHTKRDEDNDHKCMYDMKLVIVVVRLNILVVQLGLEGRLPPWSKRSLDSLLFILHTKNTKNIFSFLVPTFSPCSPLSPCRRNRVYMDFSFCSYIIVVMTMCANPNWPLGPLGPAVLENLVLLWFLGGCYLLVLSLPAIEKDFSHTS